MNCPKCGYSQEERADCRKCGIVFAKYYAFHKPLDGLEPMAPPSADSGLGEIAEMQRALRDLTRRYGEVEFERAERQRLREEIRSLEHRLTAETGSLSSRMSEIEKGVSHALDVARLIPEEIGQFKRSVSERIDPLVRRLEQVETKLDLITGARNDNRMMDALRTLEHRIAESEAVLGKLASEPRPAEDPANLAEMRAALQAVTLRYSEIGDLKKNHLVLLNKQETLQREVDASRNGGHREITDKVREMQVEIPALRAEMRQILKHLEMLEAASQTAGESDSSLRTELDGVMKAVSDLGSELALMRAELSQVEENLEPPPLEPEPLPAGSLEDDVRAIRQDMREIRSFIHSLAEKA